MAIARRSDASDTHATSATSMSIAVATLAPVDGDRLIAIVHEIVQGTITPPAGWTLLGSQDAGSNVRASVYYKDASGETGTYSWSIATSTKCSLWIGCYSGVDTTIPPVFASSAPSSGTAVATPAVTLLDQSWLISAACTRHTATGSLSTWTDGTGGDSERLDFGSNAGSGSDIGMAVYDSATALSAGSASRTLTSTQTEGQIAAFSIGISPPGAPPPGTLAGVWGIPI